MATTKSDIRVWFEDGIKKGATHMMVVCDTYDHEDFPVYVMPGENVREKLEENHGPNMQKVMEVYSLGTDMELQLNERRAFHLE